MTDDFPEVLYNERDYQIACKNINLFFTSHKQPLQNVCIIAAGIKNIYMELEPMFHTTEKVCHQCLNPCCVNRHGFPEFEDLVLFRAMGVKSPSYNFNVLDTDRCQFLTKNGCRLKRYNRSYRCTWYFCNNVLDSFQQHDLAAFRRFDETLSHLAIKRNCLLKEFSKLWFESA
jgi:hypothetical protein